MAFRSPFSRPALWPAWDAVLNYIPQGNFRRKDFLGSGDPDKLIVAAELAVEWEAIQRAINSHSSGSYTIATAFRPKDSLAHGNPLKVVNGVDLDGEFDRISTALIALGGSYAPVYDGAALDAADTEITGDPIQDELERISLDIETIRATAGGQNIITEDVQFELLLTETGEELLTDGTSTT